MPPLKVPEVEHGDESPDEALRYERDAWFRVGGSLEQVPTRFYDRAALKAGNRLEGPAIVNQYDSTTVIPPGLTAHVDRFGNIVIGTGVAAEAEAVTAAEVVEMSVVEYEVGRQPGPPTRKRVEVDPITLRVLGGAFHAIAKEMAGVLFRMSLLVDHPRVGGPRRRHLRRRGPRALRVGLDADAHRLAALVHPRLPLAAGGRDRGRAT